MRKVSFDFDDTLSFESTQEYAKSLMNISDIEVHIVTSRYKNIDDYPKEFLAEWEKEFGKKATNDDLYEVAGKLGIPEEHIHFTNMVDKYVFFNDTDFIWHLDDNNRECYLINVNTSTKGINALSGNYIYECNNLLNIE